MISITIITPAYNAEHFIAEVIESVRSQVGLQYEHIVVDDGSTDNTASILARYSKLDSRIVPIFQQNQGEATAINNAYKLARGDYIAVVNADDPLLPNSLRESLNVFSKYPCTVCVYPDWKMIDTKSTVIRIVNTIEFSYKALIADFVCIPGPGAVFRASAVKRDYLRDTNLKYLSDFEFWLELSKSGSFRRNPIIGATWRRHTDGQTALIDPVRYAFEVEYVRNKAQVLVQEHTDNPKEFWLWSRSLVAHSAYYVALKSLNSKEIPGRRLIGRSLSQKPFPSRGYETHHRNPLAVLCVLMKPLGNPILRIRDGIRYGRR